MAKTPKASKNKNLPVQAVCRNCGAQTVGRYCHICGQDLFTGTGRKLGELLGNSLDVVFAWDNKVWRTLAYLVAFPGRLTKEYFRGRITRYVYPAKLFWFLSIIFFALLMSGLEFGDGITIGNIPQQTGEVAQTAGAADTQPENRGILSIPEVQSFFSSAAPYIVLLLVPLFALLIYVFWRSKELYYSDYLVFALHFHAFVFLLLSVMLVLRKIFPTMEGGPWFLLWIPMAYLGVSLRTAFHSHMVPMIFKILLVVVLYGIILITVTILFLLLFVFLFAK